MLKITRSSNGDGITLRFEGKLLEPWLTEATELVDQAAAEAESVSLDLSRVSFVDTLGAAFLRRVSHRGIHIVGCSNFVAELLQLEKDQWSH